MSEEHAFKFVRPIKVIFRDLDGMRHVNHAVYLSYCEAARNEYWMHVTGISRVEQYDFVLAELTARYRFPASLGDELLVACGVTELHRSSFVMQHEIRQAQGGKLVADLSIVGVMYDYAADKTMRLSEQRRHQIEAFEGRGLSMADAEATRAD
ncbi:MAG: acyl-CoA thioesterase [Candidatus Eremiobacter antarcticus]|nr:acyl-CoA thioesterase [Candidatus Eremiobacteraeota bacterium]MBC5808718.1 acyl-CoA thioesterase [Candidatus Eremiobacteraeota bacterium]PZR62195.1 MAG: acyl-CoA thioesterase [Candidatus Eremiobacter sp. RRmetagenome_bin22]